MLMLKVGGVIWKSAEKRVPKLTDKQEQFCLEYLIDLNATQAAIRAGYSPDTSQQIGSENLSKPLIAERIAELQAERSESTRIDAEWVLRRLAAELEADVADLIAADTGNLRPIHEWPDIWRKGLVAGLDVTTEKDKDGKEIGYTSKIKLSDRVRRLELIGKHVDVMAYATRIEATGQGGGPIETKDISGNDLARRIAFALTSAVHEAEEDA